MFDRIDTICFKNYKCFTGSAFEELDFTKPVNVFIGRNNTGKSSILDIIDFLYCDINTEEGRKKLGKQVDQGTVFQFGYDLQGVSVKQVDPAEPLTKGKSLAWYEAESYETYSYFGSESANKWTPININPQNEYLIEDRQRIIQEYYKLLSNIYFRRINADRDIVAEIESDGAELAFNGSGTTNSIEFTTKLDAISPYDFPPIPSATISKAILLFLGCFIAAQASSLFCLINPIFVSF